MKLFLICARAFNAVTFFHNFAWLFRFCYLIGGYRAHNMSITGCAYSQKAQLLVTCSADSEGKIHTRGRQNVIKL